MHFEQSMLNTISTPSKMLHIIIVQESFICIRYISLHITKTRCVLVNSESYGIECHNCQSWTHIECDTGKSIYVT